MIEPEMEALIRRHFEDIVKIGKKYGEFLEDQNPTVEEVVSFALHYRILELDRFLSENLIPDRKTLSTLRVYGELLKIAKTTKDLNKDEKLSFYDPIEQLRKKIKIQELK